MKATLLIPAPGDPHGLLTPGKCGARPPRARRFVCDVHGWGEWMPVSWENCHCHSVVPEPDPLGRPRCFKTVRHEDGLVLAWDGERLREGILQAWFHADDAGTEVLSDLMYDDDDGLPGLAVAIGNLRRNGKPLGEVVTL